MTVVQLQLKVSSVNQPSRDVICEKHNLEFSVVFMRLFF